VLYRKASSDIPKDAKEKIQQLISNWLQYSRRFYGITKSETVVKRIENDMISDIMFATRLSREKVKNMLAGDPINGGFGVLGIKGDLYLDVSDAQMTERNRDVSDEIRKIANGFGSKIDAYSRFFPYLSGRKIEYELVKKEEIIGIKTSSASWNVHMLPTKEYFYGDNPLWQIEISEDILEKVKSGEAINYFDESARANYLALEQMMTRRLFIETLKGEKPKIFLENMYYNTQLSTPGDWVSMVYGNMRATYGSTRNRISANYFKRIVAGVRSAANAAAPDFVVFT
jgi:hypothetical protein